MSRLIIAMVNFLFIFLLFTSTTFASEKYIIDHAHSYILFKIKHFDFSSQSGKWYINGEMELDKEHPEKSKVVATVNLPEIVTGIAELDKHLKAKLFFDTNKYPLAKFVSTKVEITGPDSAKVHGELDLHGVKKPITLDVQLNKAGVSPISGKETVGFTAKTILKRSDFDMNAHAPGLGNDVQIEIEVEANQPKQKTPHV